MKCTICPRNCGVDREVKKGFCAAGNEIKVAKVMLHKWEEPCISGQNGTGAIFFSGCPLKCVMCQNKDISRNETGKTVDEDELCRTFFSLKEKGAESISLITPTHYIDKIIPALRRAKNDQLGLPIVYNTSGYESVGTLRALEGLIDVYLPDFKYIDSETAKKYSFAEDYPERAKEALDEMTRQKPYPEYNENGIMTSGVLIRHLILPSHTEESKEALKYLFGRYGYMVMFSLMSQYTPADVSLEYPELQRRITEDEYAAVTDFCVELGMENAYVQELSSSSKEFIPDFLE